MNIKIIEKHLDFRRNIIVEGKTSSGKTSQIIFPLVDNIIYKNSNLFIMESKSEYYQKYKDILQSKNYNIINLDFKNKNSIDKLNIFSIPAEYFKNNDKILCIQSLRNIADIIIKSPNGKDYTYAKNTFIGIVLSLFYGGQFKINLVNIKEIVSEKGSNILTRFIEESKNDEELYPYLENLYNDELKNKICLLINNILNSYIMNDNIATITNDSNIDFNTNPIAIIVNTTENNKYIDDIANIYLDQIYEYMKYINTPINIILENHLDKTKTNNLETMMLFSVTNKIKFIISTNDLEEFANKYDKFVIQSSDIIKINDNEIEIIQDVTKETYDKEFTFFNIDLCLKEIENQNIDEVSLNKMNMFNDKPSLDSTNLDNLLKEIEEKINEINTTTTEMKTFIKEPINIDDLDFEEFNSNPYDKIDFETELTLEYPNNETNEKIEVEDKLDDFSIDSLEINNNKEIDDFLKEDGITVNNNIDDLINLIDDKLLELDGNIKEDNKTDKEVTDAEDYTDVLEFLKED